MKIGDLVKKHNPCRESDIGLFLVLKTVQARDGAVFFVGFENEVYWKMLNASGGIEYWPIEYCEREAIFEVISGAKL